MNVSVDPFESTVGCNIYILIMISTDYLVF